MQFRKTLSLFALVIILLSAVACSGQKSRDSDLGTLIPGTISVAIHSYMPYSGLDDNGTLTGLDGDILHTAADRLGYELSVSVTDFAGALAAVQSGCADMTLGSVGWSADRAQGGLFTDPLYYSPVSMVVRKGANLTTISQLEGKTIAVETGGFATRAFQAIPRATIKTYTSSAAAIADIAIGRVDVYPSDPLLAVYAVEANPSLDVEVSYLSAPTSSELAAHPDYKLLQPYMTGFYIAKTAPALESALTQQILEMYSDGTLAQLVTKWGGDPKSYLTPLSDFAEQRVGVDRPKGWRPPSDASQ